MQKAESSRSPMKLMMTMTTPEWMLMKVVELVAEAAPRKRKREEAQKRKSFIFTPLLWDTLCSCRITT